MNSIFTKHIITTGTICLLLTACGGGGSSSGSNASADETVEMLTKAHLKPKPDIGIED